VSAAPLVAEVSRHKSVVFIASGAMMALNYWLVVVRPRRCAPGDVCHVDSPLMRWSRRIYWVSVFLYGSALLLTYAAVTALER
jgi:hypothetical protein